MPGRASPRPTALNPDRLFGQVAQRLAVGIISGEIAAGELLPDERDLRDEISVSRSAYREAVRFLTAKGLVEAKPRSGTRAAPRAAWNLLDPDVLGWHFFADPNETFIRDLFELRRMIEPSAARLAALRRTSADLDRMAAAFREMTENRPYAQATIEADLAFHEAIFGAARNDSLRCLASVVGATIRWSLVLKSHDDRKFYTESLVDHERVMQAIAVRDGDLAAARAEALVLDSLSTTLTFLTASPAARAAKIA